MKLNQKRLVQLCESINTPERRERRRIYGRIFLMYEGGGRSLIMDKIRKEFKNPEAVVELEGRLVPINIMKKVVDKSAGVYAEAPVRVVVDQHEGDEQLLEAYEDAARINLVQKECNRHLVMFRKYLKEFYVDTKGRPRIRVNPAHTYEVFNFENPDPAQPDVICKIVNDDMDPEAQRIYHYSDESFFITNGKGVVQFDQMDLFANKGNNPIKSMPFIFRTSTTYGVDPVVDEELLSISVCLPIVLTDLFFACKYQCWSLIYTIGVIGDINVNPSSVLQLQRDPNDPNGGEPKVGTVQPNVDVDAVINLVKSVLAMFLSARGLSVSSISAGSNPADTVSGVSKMLDNAEVVEGKKDQQDIFLYEEGDMWDLISKSLVPYWRRNKLLNAALNKGFSQNFTVSVLFRDPKVLLSEKDTVEIEALKMKERLTTHKRALQRLNPDFSDSQLDELMQEISEEQPPEQPPEDPNHVPELQP